MTEHDLDALARAVHKVWAHGRTAEGWVYGPTRDDIAKTHPGLVPYDDLSASEQAYDRATAQAVLDTLGTLGYRLVPPERDGDSG